MPSCYQNFYNEQYTGGYCNTIKMEDHSYYPFLSNWLEHHSDYMAKKFFEIGSGRGALQDIVADYTGLDYSQVVSGYYHKPFFSGSAENLSFSDNTFDVVWSYAVWEHIPNPERALEETIRVLKSGGRFLFSPAWHCRSWAAKGYQVRPYSDFDLWGKIYKFLIPVMDWLPFRAAGMLVKRTMALIFHWLRRGPRKLCYKQLEPNYDIFWQSDSDACNNLDPFMVILWFEERGHKCISHNSFLKKFAARNGTVEFEIRK